MHLKVHSLLNYELKTMVDEQTKMLERIKYLWDVVRKYVTSLKAISRIKRMNLLNSENITSGFTGLNAKTSLHLGKKHAAIGPVWYTKCWIGYKSNIQAIWELIYSISFFFSFFVIPFNQATK